MNTKESRIVGIFPHKKGYGYVLFQDAEKILSFGNAYIAPVDNDNCLKRISSFIRLSHPNLLVVREDSVRGSERTNKLLADIKRIAQDEDIFCISYSRKHIREAFGSLGVTRKYDIARTICKWFPNLEKRLPKERKSWTAEHHRMGLFDAIALVCTHYMFMSLDNNGAE